MRATNRCLKCNTKLSSRNKNKGTKAFHQLCSECFKNPSDEDRCTMIKSNGERCKFRRSKKSDTLCGVHLKQASRRG